MGNFYQYFFAAGLVILTSLFGIYLKANFDPASFVMVYLLIVVFSAVRWGIGPAIVTSILSAVAFDFFLSPPYMSFRIADVRNIFTFVGLLAVGLVVSNLAAKAREQAIQARQREAEAVAMYNLQKKLDEESRKLELMRETEKLQTALLNSISHDLRTPLVSIKGTLSVLLQDPTLKAQESRRELLETAYEDSGRLNHLVNDLLEMTRVEAGTLKVRSEPCELIDIVRASLQQLNNKIERRQIRVDIPKDLPLIPMDFTLMMEVLMNLLDNALKYSSPYTPVEIIARFVEKKVKIEIKDSGFGIPEEDLKRIFDKFYRAVNPKRVTGTGLGLSICKGIVEAHGGEIYAGNNPEGGAVITILMPLEEAKAL